MRQVNFLYKLHILITFFDRLWADTGNVFIVLSLSSNHLFSKKEEHFIYFDSMFILKLVRDFIFNLKVKTLNKQGYAVKELNKDMSLMYSFRCIWVLMNA